MAASITHGSFLLGRTVRAPIEKVFAAFADQQAKARWFKGPQNYASDHRMDFREGGSEHNSTTFPDGTIHRFEAQYHDIVPNERIIYSYEMYLNNQRISVSLATIIVASQGDGTTYLEISEDATFLNDQDGLASRQQGTEELMNGLIRSLESLEG